jgi:short-subunit dehydrogenase
MDSADTRYAYPWREDFLEGSSFVVGGASSGLGRAVAEQLLTSGARVLLVARKAEALQETARELGEGAFLCAADLATPSGAEAIVEEPPDASAPSVASSSTPAEDRQAPRRWG